MAEPLVHHRGIAAPLLVDNIDTDQIIPSHQMRTVSREGLGQGLFANWRYSDVEARTSNPDFILNRTPFDGASIILARQNFGCGSSREHAVWALAEFGIRVVIAASFGAIFQSNCARNGVLAIALGDAIAPFIAPARDGTEFTVDLPNQTVSAGEAAAAFEIDPFAKRLLVEGLDPIGLTLRDTGAIEAFQARDEAVRPWAYI